MKTVQRISGLKQMIREAKKSRQTIGFVPTMGYLHEGHLTLMRQAKKENDLVIASIFVNPLQFGPSEDYAVYPRDLARDSQLAAEAGVDILFAPEVADMYPGGYENMMTTVAVSGVSEGLCGASRPGHFRGVATVVTKLFNIVEADTAYFGQKDAQQAAVIRQMALDLNMNVKIVSVPIVREADGLALSSRNVFLSPQERQAALSLSRSLRWAREQLEAGQRQASVIAGGMREIIEQEPLAQVDYIAVVDALSLAELTHIHSPALLALAVKIGKTRLIDNDIWEAR